MQHNFDPHFMHGDIWRDFDKSVAQTLRRRRRARFLAALWRRDKQHPSRQGSAPRTLR